MKCLFLFAFFAATVGFVAGCDEHRAPPAEAKRGIHVEAPGATVDVRPPSDAATPRRDAVDVEVGQGGVGVDVDGPQIRERIRERREEAAAPQN